VKKDEKRKKKLVRLEMALAIITAIFALFSAVAGLAVLGPNTAAVVLNVPITTPLMAQAWTRTVNIAGQVGSWQRMATWAGPRMVGETQITTMQSVLLR
jgi:hypothetical protein